MSKERILQKQEEIKSKIIKVAQEIILTEGLKGLTIRKITNKLDYSPAIIYHYFEGKAEIVEAIVNEGYKNILGVLASSREKPQEDPHDEIKEMFRMYALAALEYPMEYKAFMLNDNTQVLKRTAIMDKMASKKSDALKILCNQLQRGIDIGRFSPVDVELTAQILWVSVFGLIIRLILEKEVSAVQRNRLIEHQINILLNGLTKG